MKLRELLYRSLWLAPLVLSLIFVLGVLAWVRANEAEEQDQQRQTLISDALSTEAQLRDRIGDEQVQLRPARRQPGRPAAHECHAGGPPRGECRPAPPVAVRHLAG